MTSDSSRHAAPAEATRESSPRTERPPWRWFNIACVTVGLVQIGVGLLAGRPLWLLIGAVLPLQGLVQAFPRRVPADVNQSLEERPILVASLILLLIVGIAILLVVDVLVAYPR